MGDPPEDQRVYGHQGGQQEEEPLQVAVAEVIWVEVTSMNDRRFYYFVHMSNTIRVKHEGAGCTPDSHVYSDL